MGCCCSSKRVSEGKEQLLNASTKQQSGQYDAFLPSAQSSAAFQAKYKLVKLLGSGHIAKCYSCRLEADGSIMFAAKIGEL
jgi:hypothetical protein